MQKEKRKLQRELLILFEMQRKERRKLQEEADLAISSAKKVREIKQLEDYYISLIDFLYEKQERERKKLISSFAKKNNSQ